MKKLHWAGLAVILSVFTLLTVLSLSDGDDASPVSVNLQITASADAIQRGEYLARAGNCMHCHTQRGGAIYAGGRALETPFGTVYTSNLTPDADTGIGRWSAEDFWQALHRGRSKDGHWLLPAFPYANFTRVSREDSDALYAWLRSLPAVSQANRAHTLAWPFNSQWALGLWRALFFRAEMFRPQANRSIDWNRGAYLVQGLGHCGACHSTRNALGASRDMAALSGGMIPMQNWYAPSLASRSEASSQQWETQELVQLLQTGTSARGWAAGPMADVVLHSTQHLTPFDLSAMAIYLRDLPPSSSGDVRSSKVPVTAHNEMAQGAKLYKEHCAQCHASDGTGIPHAYPALAGSTAVNLETAVNLVQIVLNGSFAPATSGNPRPFGMPPFAVSLSDHDIAAVLSYIRSSWGNRAGEVTPQDVDRLRGHTR
jgi:mono/diheme cytochrome c family protein